MIADSDLPSLWTHEPRSALQFRTGDLVEDIDTAATPGFTGSKDEARVLQVERNERFAGLQEMLYANSRQGDARSLLLVLQGMDTAGKGGIVKHVVGAANPMGIHYKAFGPPTERERAHHYLWRIRAALPPHGNIGVFDRSHYEDVLVVRVNNLVPEKVWSARYDEINEFEYELGESGITVVKVALFLSLKEQKKHLVERLERADKYWKYNPTDIDERQKWPAYQEAYQAVFDRTSTEHAPWYVVPCDKRWYSRLAVTELLIDALKGFNMSWPPPDFDVELEQQRLAES